MSQSVFFSVDCSTLKIVVENTIFKLAIPTAVTEQFSKLTVPFAVPLPYGMLRVACPPQEYAKARAASGREVRTIRRRVKVIPSCNQCLLCTFHCLVNHQIRDFGSSYVPS